MQKRFKITELTKLSREYAIECLRVDMLKILAEYSRMLSFDEFTEKVKNYYDDSWLENYMESKEALFSVGGTLLKINDK